MLMRTGVMAVSAAVAAMMFGCSPQPSATVAVVKDKIYSVTPAAMKVKSGIVTGELTEMKVTERIEEGSGRITSPAKLSGKLVLKNVSSDQTLRLIGGKVLYIDMQGKPIKLEENRTAPMLRIASSYGSQERLDPGPAAVVGVALEEGERAGKAQMPGCVPGRGRAGEEGGVAAGVAVQAGVENPVEPLIPRHAVAQAESRVELVVDVQFARLGAVEMARQAVDVHAPVGCGAEAGKGERQGKKQAARRPACHATEIGRAS